MSCKQWGELQLPSMSASASTVVDMEALAMKSQSIQVKGPHLHQPTAQQKPHIHPIQAELCRPDYTSLHTIDLLKHCRQIRSKMTIFQHQHDSIKGEDRFSRPLLPPLPSQPQMIIPERTSTSIPIITGIKERPGCPRLKLREGSIEIDSCAARQLSRRAVATICAHSGYDTSQESSLETLTDVLHEFLSNTCKLLRVAVDREALTGHTGFQDTLTQVLNEIGIGSRNTLFDFWKTRIEDYHNRIVKQTEELREMYEDMKNPNYQLQSQDDKSPRVKEEPLSDTSFQDPQSHSLDEATENQSETSSSETPSNQPPSNQPLSFHSLGTLELDDTSVVTAPPTAGTGESVEVADDEEDGNEWYAGVKEEDPGEEDGSTGIGSVKREVMSGDESSQDVKMELIEESSVVSQIPGHTPNADETSLGGKKIQLHMPPRKKKKK